MKNSALTVDRIACPVCGDSAREVLFSARHDSPGFMAFIELEPYWSKEFYETYENTLGNTLVYEIAECCSCNMCYLTQVLNYVGMGLLYNVWLDKDLLKNHYGERSLNHSHEMLLAIVKSKFGKKRKPRLLDFGAGYGNLVTMAAEMGFETHAFDISADKNSSIGSAGVSIVSDLGEFPDYFDFIWVNQVLEHLEDPAAVLGKLKSSLAKGGVMYLAVPDCSNLKGFLAERGLSRELFQLLSPHQHINAFTGSTLRLIGRKNGLEPLVLTDYLGLYSSRMSVRELKFLAKKILKSSSASTGLLFKSQC